MACLLNTTACCLSLFLFDACVLVLCLCCCTVLLRFLRRRGPFVLVAFGPWQVFQDSRPLRVRFLLISSCSLLFCSSPVLCSVTGPVFLIFMDWLSQPPSVHVCFFKIPGCFPFVSCLCVLVLLPCWCLLFVVLYVVVLFVFLGRLSQPPAVQVYFFGFLYAIIESLCIFDLTCPSRVGVLAFALTTHRSEFEVEVHRLAYSTRAVKLQLIVFVLFTYIKALSFSFPIKAFFNQCWIGTGILRCWTQHHVSRTHSLMSTVDNLQLYLLRRIGRWMVLKSDCVRFGP